MRRRVTWSVVWLLYVGMVFHYSMIPAVDSSAQSMFVLDKMLKVLQAADISDMRITEHFIRKSAHFAEYAGMGILLCGCLGVYGFPTVTRWQLHVLLGFLVPFVDETIQLFVEGRSGQISDVWLDCAGVVFGTVLFLAFRQFGNYIRQRRVKHRETGQCGEGMHNIEKEL